LGVATRAFANDERVLADEQMAAVERNAGMVAALGSYVKPSNRELTFGNRNGAFAIHRRLGEDRRKTVIPMSGRCPKAASAPFADWGLAISRGLRDKEGEQQTPN
jgi:hypothetical protein